MLKYIDEVVGCKIKTYDEMCAWAHYDPGVAKGGRFTGFKCGCCGYQPSEKKWRADLAKWHKMTDEEQHAARANHFDRADELNHTNKHYHQVVALARVPTVGSGGGEWWRVVGFSLRWLCC